MRLNKFHIDWLLSINKKGYFLERGITNSEGDFFLRIEINMTANNY